MASFGEILAEFKNSEEPDNIVSIIGDNELQNGIVAWKSVRIHFKPLTDCDKKDQVEKWEWLWDQVEYDVSGFGVVAGVKPFDAGRLIQRLIGLRLIYPDGSVCRFAKQYLQSVIIAKIKPAQRGRPPANLPASPVAEKQ
jgi:hypothetical protein